MPTTDEVPPEPTVQPNIEQIAKLIAPNGPVHRAEEASITGRADLGNHYQRIQNDLHGHRGAVKAVRKLLAGSKDAGDDFMRTFEPLAEHFGLFPSQSENHDLVDEAEGTASTRGTSALSQAKKHLEGRTKPEQEPEVAAKGRNKLTIVAQEPETKQ